MIKYPGSNIKGFIAERMLPSTPGIVYIIVILFFSTVNIFAQKEKIQITAKGNLNQNEVNGVKFREFVDNVEIRQGNMITTCDRAIYYYEKDEAELIGNVVSKQDTITIKTPKGYYYGAASTVTSVSGIELNDSHFTLRSRKGSYNFDEKKAVFTEGVVLFDSNSHVIANKLTYFRDEDKAVAVGNVEVRDTSSVIFADSLINFRIKRISYGYKNVKMFNPLNKTIILAGRFENKDSTGYSKITEKPVFVQIDSTGGGKLDTLYMTSKTMEAYQDSTDRFTATDSVRMFRNNFSTVNSHTIFNRKENTIFTSRLEGDANPPLLWYENSQLIGDSIYINIDKKKLKQIRILQNAFMLSMNEGFQYRYDQISGRKINMNFTDGEINMIDIDGNLLSIYYLYDEKDPNGLVKSSSERGRLIFKDKKIEDVKLYGAVVSDYHPENIILGKEKDFTLPGFIIYNIKPRKEQFLTNQIEAALIKLDEIIKNSDGKYSNIKKREPKKGL